VPSLFPVPLLIRSFILISLSLVDRRGAGDLSRKLYRRGGPRSLRHHRRSRLLLLSIGAPSLPGLWIVNYTPAGAIWARTHHGWDHDASCRRVTRVERECRYLLVEYTQLRCHGRKKKSSLPTPPPSTPTRHQSCGFPNFRALARFHCQCSSAWERCVCCTPYSKSMGRTS